MIKTTERSAKDTSLHLMAKYYVNNPIKMNDMLFNDQVLYWLTAARIEQDVENTT